jgi:hypothetical protein
MAKKVKTCRMASTRVTVFPVPGGPNTMYGMPDKPPLRMFLTLNQVNNKKNIG